MYPEDLRAYIVEALDEFSRGTRRERIATAALQGILAAGHYAPWQNSKVAASCSVEFADALIAELDEEDE